MAILFDSGVFSVIGLAGEILPGAKLYWYDGNTSTPLATYSDDALTVPNANPVVAGSDGRFPKIFLQNKIYKYILTNAAGSPASPIVTRFPISGLEPEADTIDYTAPNSTQTQTVAARLDQRLDLRSYMTEAQINESAACKLQTDTAPDMTGVLQGLINDASGATLRIDIPTIVNTSTGLIVPAGTNINWDGINSAYEFLSSGVYYTGGGLRWTGAANGVMLKLDTTNGSTVKNLLLESKSSDVNVIAIPGVIGIQVVNKGASHFLSREHCNFSKLGIGTHFYDEGVSPTSDFNMDGQIGIQNCYVSCVECIRVEQTNVYGAMEYRPSFFGNANYTKHFVNVVKGHYAVDTPDCTALKNAGSVGGRNGCAFYVQFGYITVTNIHSEIKNGPVFDWVAPGEGRDTCKLSFQGDNTESASLPNAWAFRNQTNNSLIIEGSIANSVEQKAGTTGSITINGAQNPPSATAASQPHAVNTNGGSLNSRPGTFGTLANGTSGGGRATLQGYLPSLRLVDYTDGSTGRVDYATGKIKLIGNIVGPSIDVSGTGTAANVAIIDLTPNASVIRASVRPLASWQTIFPTPVEGLMGMMVSDSTVTAAGNYGAAITGGGSNTVPASYYAGAWRIG